MPEYKVRADAHCHPNLFEYQLMCGDKRTLKKARKMAKGFARRELNAMRKADVESFAFGGDFRRDKQDLPKFTLGQKVFLFWARWMHSAKEPPSRIGGKKGKKRPEWFDSTILSHPMKLPSGAMYGGYPVHGWGYKVF